MNGARRPGTTIRQACGITLALVTVAALPALVEWTVAHPVLVWGVAAVLAGTFLAVIPALDVRTVSRYPARRRSSPISDSHARRNHPAGTGRPPTKGTR